MNFQRQYSIMVHFNFYIKSGLTLQRNEVLERENKIITKKISLKILEIESDIQFQGEDMIHNSLQSDKILMRQIK